MLSCADTEWTTIGPRDPAKLELPPNVLALTTREALERAVSRAAAFLEEAARAKEPVLIVVNDPARATPTRWVFEALASRTSKPHRPALRLLVATGTHRFDQTECERFERAMLAGCQLDFDEVAWHDCTDEAQLATCRAPEHRLAGSTGGGSFRINHRVLEHDRLLAIGSVEPHYFAGVTGAHKTATIGCLAREDIERNHAGALHPASDLLALEGNPVFDGIAALMTAASASSRPAVSASGSAPNNPSPRHFLVFNQVAVNDRPLSAACGEWRETLDALLPLVRAVFTHEIETPYDVLHLRVPLPLGRDLYQADKALKNCHRAVRDGGLIILDAACPHGVGPDAFLSLLRRAPDYATACEIVRGEGYKLSDHKAVKLRCLMDPKARGVRVVVVSSALTESEIAGTGLELMRSPDEALTRVPPGAGTVRGLRVEDAGMVCLQTRSCPHRA